MKRLLSIVLPLTLALSQAGAVVVCACGAEKAASMSVACPQDAKAQCGCCTDSRGHGCKKQICGAHVDRTLPAAAKHSLQTLPAICGIPFTPAFIAINPPVRHLYWQPRIRLPDLSTETLRAPPYLA